MMMHEKKKSKPDIRTKSAARNADPYANAPLFLVLCSQQREREREGLVVVYVRVVSRKGKRGDLSQGWRAG